MKALIEHWKNLVDSVASRGGAIILLFTLTILSGLCLIHLMHHGDTGDSASTIRNCFTGFSSALLLSLTTTAKANGKGDTANPTQAPNGAQEITHP